MSYLLVRHTVKNYEQWKKVFEESKPGAQGGFGGGKVLRGQDDPNEIFLLLEILDIHKAKEFMQSRNLKECMEKSGVIDKPDVFYLEEAMAVKPAAEKTPATTSI